MSVRLHPGQIFDGSWSEVAAAFDARLSTAGTEPERWRMRAAARCARSLARAGSPVDRGALLREFVRLADGEARIGSRLVDGVLFQRFALAAEPDSDGTMTIRLAEWLQDREIPEDLEQALRLDAAPRRRSQPVPGDAFLTRLSSFADYKSPAQRAALRAVVTMPLGATLMAAMPTGWGKSLVFQVATRWWRESRPAAATVVVVPTVALALDHQRALREKPGLGGSRALTGSMTATERTEVVQAFARGDVPILLLSPEMALNSCRQLLLDAAAGPEGPAGVAVTLAGFVIDEAHLVESWGRHFRPDFQRIPALVQELRRRNPAIRVVLLSATIGQSARELLFRQYAAEGRPFEFVQAREPRTEFEWVVQEFASSAQRESAVLRALDLVPRPAILYTTEVEDAGRLHDALARSGYQRLALFTGELQADDARRAIVERWSSDDLDLVVGTSAFGMGVDKQDVRAVVHACVPEDAQRLYQEIGRGGRDGHQALALLLWTGADLVTARSLAAKNWMGVDKSVKRWRSMVRDARDRGRFSRRPDGTPCMKIRVDAEHEELGRHTGAHNRRWNMTLLVLLQRAGVLEVLEIEGGEAGTWNVAIHDANLLEEGPASTERLMRIITIVIGQERGEAKEKSDQIEEFLRTDLQDCWMCTLFDMVEGARVATTHCGRCPGCRRLGAEPVHEGSAELPAASWTESRWSGAIELPLGAHVIHPTDRSLSVGLSRLLGALLARGVEQFLVHASLEVVCCRELERSRARLGLVGRVPGEIHALARLPTAVLVPERSLDAEVLRRACMDLRRRFAAWPEISLTFVLSPVEAARGIPLAQHLSARAPLDEAQLYATLEDQE